MLGGGITFFFGNSLESTDGVMGIAECASSTLFTMESSEKIRTFWNELIPH
jgi:hypothetical protein